MSGIETVIKVIDYIEEHLSEKQDLGTIAAALNYSKYHLHREFKNAVGLTIHDYTNRRQMTEAAKLVAFSKMSFTDIALLAGYESHQAFTNAFKLLYKKTPSQFREGEIFYPLQLKFELGKTGEMFKNKNAVDADIRFATEDDIPAWTNFIRQVIDGFPYMDEQEHIKVLKENIAKKQVFILTDGDTAAGGMIFERKSGDIGFFGIHPLYKNKGLSKLFFEKLLEELNGEKPISVTTYREGDKADTGQREEFKRLGFADAELMTEFGYPTQRLILKKGDFDG